MSDRISPVNKLIAKLKLAVREEKANPEVMLAALSLMLMDFMAFSACGDGDCLDELFKSSIEEFNLTLTEIALDSMAKYKKQAKGNK